MTYTTKEVTGRIVGVEEAEKEAVQNLQRQVDKLQEKSRKPTILASSDADLNIWEIYRKQFEATATLRKEALKVLQILNESRYKNYEDLVEHLEMRFGNKYLEQMHKAQLLSRSQRSKNAANFAAI